MIVATESFNVIRRPESESGVTWCYFRQIPAEEYVYTTSRTPHRGGVLSVHPQPVRVASDTSPEVIRKVDESETLISSRFVNINKFVGRLYRLAKGDGHAAVDEIYRFIDERLLSGQYSAIAECNDAIGSVNTNKLTIAQIVSFLIVTRRARGKGLLVARDGFYERSLISISANHGIEKAGRILEKYR